MEEDNISSKKSYSSKKSDKSYISKKEDSINTESNIVSQLELMANKKKILKQNTVENKSESIKSKSKTNSTSSSKSSKDDSKVEKRRIREIEKENKIEKIRKEKSELIYKFNKLNTTYKGKLSSLKLDMNNSLLEIKTEFIRIKTDVENEQSVSFYKRMLLLGIQGVERLNKTFDPLGVDLDGWSEALGYSLENQEYDEVLLELYEKYKTTSKMSPELKLIGMIVMSATLFTATKHISKFDSNFTNILSNIFAQQNNNIPQQPQNYQQHQNHQPKYVQPSETSEDIRPSKMKGPEQNIDIENILKTMRENEKNNNDIKSEELFKSINIKKKGRPKKVK